MLKLRLSVQLSSRIWIIVLVAFICFAKLSFSQSDINSRISIGLETLYNFNFKSSENIFGNIIKIYPDNPTGYYYKSLSHLWFFLDSKNEIELENFLSLTDSAIERAETIFKQDSTNLMALYILGSCYANRSFAFTRNENYFDAVLDARKFNNAFEILLEKDSLYYDAYMDKGLFNFTISQAPQTWSWAINLAGMTGDKKTGLNYLKIASQKGRFTKIDAQFYLSQIYSEFLLNYGQAYRLLNELNSRFPKNLLFRFTLANLQVKTFNLNEAIKNYKSIFNSKDTSLIELKYYAGMSLGDIYYSQGEFESANKYYLSFLENATDDYFKGITALKIGLSHLIEGDSLSALLYFDKVSNGNEDLDIDIYAKVKGEEYLNQLPPMNEIKLIMIRNMIDAGKFNSSIDSLEKFVNKNISDTLRAIAILYLSDAYYHLGKNKKSLEYAVAVFNFADCEIWVKAFACYYAARASKELNNLVDAEFFIGYSNNFSNYFFENKLKDKLSFLAFIIQEK